MACRSPRNIDSGYLDDVSARRVELGEEEHEGHALLVLGHGPRPVHGPRQNGRVARSQLNGLDVGLERLLAVERAEDVAPVPIFVEALDDDG